MNTVLYSIFSIRPFCKRWNENDDFVINVFLLLFNTIIFILQYKFNICFYLTPSYLYYNISSIFVQGCKHAITVHSLLHIHTQIVLYIFELVLYVSYFHISYFGTLYLLYPCGVIFCRSSTLLFCFWYNCNWM